MGDFSLVFLKGDGEFSLARGSLYFPSSLDSIAGNRRILGEFRSADVRPVEPRSEISAFLLGTTNYDKPKSPQAIISSLW